MSIQKLEKLRVEYNEKRKKAFRISLIVAAIFATVMTVVSLTSRTSTYVPRLAFVSTIISVFFMALFPLMVGMIIFYLKNHKLAEEYKTLYKKLFVEKALSEAFPGCDYQPNVGIGERELLKTTMINTGDRYSSDDLVVGEYHGLKFRQADVLIQEEERDREGHTTYRTVFRGRWAVFDIKKDFAFKLAVVGTNFQVASLGNFGRARKFSRIKLESDSFHGRFKVYAQDGFEAFYLLDPAFLERVEALGAAHDNRVALFFDDGELHIAVNTLENAFEAASIRKPIDVDAETAKIKNDIKLITDIVDSLKLK